MKKKMIIDQKYIQVDETDSLDENHSKALVTNNGEKEDPYLRYLSIYNLNIRHAAQLALEKDPHTPFYYKLQELTQRIKDYVSLFYSKSGENNADSTGIRKTFFDQLSVGDNKRISQLMQEADQKKQKRETNRRESIFQYTHFNESFKPSKSISQRFSTLQNNENQTLVTTKVAPLTELIQDTNIDRCNSNMSDQGTISEIKSDSRESIKDSMRIMNNSSRNLKNIKTGRNSMPKIKIDSKGRVFVSHPERHKVIPVKQNRDIARCEVLGQELQRRYDYIANNRNINSQGSTLHQIMRKTLMTPRLK